MENSRKFLIKATYGKVGQKYFFQPARNPETGLFPEHIRSVDKNGDMILSDDDKALQSKGVIFFPENKIFEFECPKEFDMSKKMDKAIWEAIMYSPGIASSRSQRDKNGDYIIDGNDKKYGIAELYVENPTLESQRGVQRARSIFDAQELVFKDPRGAEGHKLMVRVIGRNMDDCDDSDVLDYLLKLCEKTPERIVSLYSSDDLPIRFMFVEARKKNVIRMKNKMYVFGSEGQIILGPTDDAVISFLRSPKNKKVLELIEKELNPFLNEGKHADSGHLKDKDIDAEESDNSNGIDSENAVGVDDLFGENKAPISTVDDILKANKGKGSRK